MKRAACSTAPRPPFRGAASLLWLVLLAWLPAASGCGDDRAESPRRTFASDVEECAVRLRDVYKAMLQQRQDEGWEPSATAKIPGDLAASPIWTAKGQALACPGGAYAGRDLAAFPLARFPTRGTEVVMACANADGGNHPGGEVNVLYADGSVVTLSLAQEIDAGRLPAGTTAIPVGPASPLEDLAKLVRP